MDYTDFNTLEEYALCVQNCLKICSHDDLMAKDSRVIVLYATAPAAYAKMEEHFANGENVGPLITFYQAGIETPADYQMGAWKYLPVVRKQGNYLYRAPIICRIKYNVTVCALTEAQADLLCTQIMQATPFHRPYYTKLNGQFVTIRSDEPHNVGSVEVTEGKDKFSRRELTLTIERAYINYDIKELNAGVIYPSDTHIEVDEKLIEKKLANGVIILKDGSVVNGEVDKNTSIGADGFFNYNVADEDGNIIDVAQKGEVKVTLYATEYKK